jgi:hypothetical protein
MKTFESAVFKTNHAAAKTGDIFVGADLRVRPSEEGAHTGAPLRHFPAAIAVTPAFDTPQLAVGCSIKFHRHRRLILS